MSDASAIIVRPAPPLGLSYFGRPWPLLPVTAGRVEVPTGERCAECGLRFLPDEQGLVLPRVAGLPDGTASRALIPYHRACFGARALR